MRILTAKEGRWAMRKLVLLALVATLVLVLSSTAGAQEIPRCIGGCDAKYWNILTYNPYEMWATYGYPTYSGGCWWYDVGGGSWWYMCPPDGNLYEYQGG